MCVLRDHWRLGIGRAILDYLVTWSQQAGLRKLYLRVYDFNDPAHPPYRTAGFTEEGRLQADIRRAAGPRGRQRGLSPDALLPGHRRRRPGPAV